MEAISASVTAPFLAQLLPRSLFVHRYTEIWTRLCQKLLVLSTCFTNSRPVPSSDRLIATTTISAIVMVRFRRRPIHTSLKTNWARMSLNPLGYPSRGRSVGLAVNSARLVAHDLAIFEFDDSLAHRVHDRGIVCGHDHRGTGPVDSVQNLHDADRGSRIDVSSRLVCQQDHGAVNEGPGHGDSLLLTTGQFVWHPVPLALEPDQVDDLGDHLPDEAARLANDLEGESNVLIDVLIRQQPEVLEHTADAPAQVRDLPVREPG